MAIRLEGIKELMTGWFAHRQPKPTFTRERRVRGSSPLV